MRTVGEFKAKGGIIVNGDQVIGCDGFVGKVMCCKTFNETIQYDEDVVVELAWRTNTGVKPEFDGRMEFECRNGHILDSDDYRCIGWVLDGHELDIIKWRPHLPAAIQTETPEEKEAFEAMNKSPYDVDAHVSDASKPVYTQAMCDAGELPPVSSWCLTTDVSGNTVFEVKCKVVAPKPDSVGNLVVIDSTGDYLIRHATELKPIQTEREKAIDEMVATAVNSADDIAKSIIYEACVKLVEAGYVKPCSNNK